MFQKSGFQFETSAIDARAQIISERWKMSRKLKQRESEPREERNLEKVSLEKLDAIKQICQNRRKRGQRVAAGDNRSDVAEKNWQ